MSMTDPIADMLTRIRNANSAYKATHHDAVFEEARRDRAHPEAGRLHRRLRRRPRASRRTRSRSRSSTAPKKERTITGIRRISKPGLRVYAKKDELPRVLGGLGIAVISTSHGVMTDRVARKAGVGGEVIAYIW